MKLIRYVPSPSQFLFFMSPILLSLTTITTLLRDYILHTFPINLTPFLDCLTHISSVSVCLHFISLSTGLSHTFLSLNSHSPPLPSPVLAPHLPSFILHSVPSLFILLFFFSRPHFLVLFTFCVSLVLLVNSPLSPPHM